MSNGVTQRMNVNPARARDADHVALVGRLCRIAGQRAVGAMELSLKVVDERETRLQDEPFLPVGVSARRSPPDAAGSLPCLDLLPAADVPAVRRQHALPPDHNRTRPGREVTAHSDDRCHPAPVGGPFRAVGIYDPSDANWQEPPPPI